MNRYQRDLQREADLNIAYYNDLPNSNLPGGINDSDAHFATGDEFETQPLPAAPVVYDEEDRLRRLDEKIAKEARVKRLVDEGIIVRGCRGCIPFLKDPDVMGPGHNASSRCESGKQDHCSCDVCF